VGTGEREPGTPGQAFGWFVNRRAESTRVGLA